MLARLLFGAVFVPLAYFALFDDGGTIVLDLITYEFIHLGD